MMTVFSMAFPLVGLFTIRSGLMSDAWIALTVRQGSAQEALVKRASHSFPLSVNLSSSSSRTSSVSQSPPLTPSRSPPHTHEFILRGRSCYAFEGASYLSSLFDALCIKALMCVLHPLALLNHFPSYLCFSILTQGLIRWDWRWAFKTSSLLLGLQFFTTFSTLETRPYTLLCTAQSLRKCGHVDFKSKSGVQAKDQWIVPWHLLAHR